MAKKSSTQMMKKQNERSRYVSVDLSVKQKADMKARFPDDSSVFEWLFKMAEEGYRFMVKYDDWNSCHACFVYPEDDDAANGGFVLVGRGSTPRGAVAGALYRHYVIFEGTWGKRDHQSVDDD